MFIEIETLNFIMAFAMIGFIVVLTIVVIYSLKLGEWLTYTLLSKLFPRNKDQQNERI